MERPGEWVTIEVARARLLAALEPRGPIEVPLSGAHGRVLAVAVAAPRNVPPFAASAMDGFALRAADTVGVASGGRVSLRLVGSAGAGRPTDVSLRAGEAVAIATGGALPEGADSVCPIEDANCPDDENVLIGAVEPGAYVRPAGSDTPIGAEVFPAGTRLAPAHVGVIASLGIATVPVHPWVRVGVLATGDEIVAPPALPGPGQIYDANRPAMLAACDELGCDTVDLGVVPDDPEQLEAALVEAASRCDVVLTSGGVSVGVADHLKKILGRLAPGAVHWMEVRMQPGKPFGFAVLAAPRTPVLCLPGNPVSALVSFELLVRPALRHLAGRTGRPRRIERAIADEAFPRGSDGKVHVVRVNVTVDHDGNLHARSAGGQGSHQLRALADANGLLLLDENEVVESGDPVRVLILDAESLDDAQREVLT